MGLIKLGIGGGSSRSSFNRRGTETRTIDPFISQYGRDTLTMFDNLTNGVLGGYRPQQPQQPQSPQYNSGGAYGGYAVNPELLYQYYGLTPPQTDTTPTATGPTSFIAPFSDDTNAAFNEIRNFNDASGQLRDMAGNLNVGRVNSPGNVGLLDQQTIDRTTIGPLATAEAMRALGYVGDYYNSDLTNSLIGATLNDYDVGTDRSANAMRARRDAGSAFGDRAALQDAVFQGEANRGRGTLSAQIRNDAYARALQAGQFDASNATDVSKFNAGSANARNLAQAQLDASRLAANADLAFRTGMANADISDRNIRNRMDADKANIDAALAETGLKADLLLGGDEAEWAKLDAVLKAGMLQDDKLQQRAQEPLDLLQLRAILLGQIPYDETINTTESGSAKGKNFNFNLGFEGGT